MRLKDFISKLKDVMIENETSDDVEVDFSASQDKYDPISDLEFEDITYDNRYNLVTVGLKEKE